MVVPQLATPAPWNAGLWGWVVPCTPEEGPAQAAPAASCQFAPLRVQAHPAVLMPQVSCRLSLLPAPRLRVNTAAPLRPRARWRCEAPPTLLQPCSNLATTYYLLATTYAVPALCMEMLVEWQPQYGNIEAMLVQICAFVGARCVRGVCMACARRVRSVCVHGACMARPWPLAYASLHVHVTCACTCTCACCACCDLRPGLLISRAVRGSRHSSRPQPGPPSPGRRKAPRRPRLPWSRRLRQPPTRSSAAFTRKRGGLLPTRRGDA